MDIQSVLHAPEHAAEKRGLPVLCALIERYAGERPFAGLAVVFGHILVRNAVVVAEALWRGGAEIVFCRAHPSPAEADVLAAFAAAGVPVLEPEEAVRAAELYLDVGAVLGRLRPPRLAAEATRTGVLHYGAIPCPVVSADDCRAKRIEGFLGTGDGLLRAWEALRPGDALEEKSIIQFGYGKIGRGVAHRLRRAGAAPTIVELDPVVRDRAGAEGFAAVEAGRGQDLRRALERAEVVISVTGVPGVLTGAVPVEWVRANHPVLVNLGAEDEFGPAYDENEILGGRSMPLNFHLPQPTLNRYVDAALSAHVLALEAVTRPGANYALGVHPLPPEMDRWVIETWRRAWPHEDLTGIAEELGLP